MFRKTMSGWIGAAAIALLSVGCGSSDPGITTAVKAKLAADDLVKAYRIDVDTKDRIVTLSGEVDNAAAHAKAVELARGTDGVSNVVDQLRVMPGVTPPGGLDDPAQQKAAEVADAVVDKTKDAAAATADATGDAAVTAKVKTKFLADTAVAGLKIDVDTKDGVVTLSGKVPNAAEKARAASIAKKTDGVKSVVNKLTIGS